MSMTSLSFRIGVIPGWCLPPITTGPVLEARRTFYDFLDYIPDLVCNAGDRIKISLFFSAVNMYAAWHDPWGIWILDSMDFSIGLSRIGDFQDRVNLHLGVYGDLTCAGWTEQVSEVPGVYNFYTKLGYYKDMLWRLVEFEKVIPAPHTNLDQWRVHVTINQEHGIDHISDSIMWFNRFSLFQNGGLVWTLDLGPEPDIDPAPLDSGTNIIRSNNEPWGRWGRPAPTCTGV